jgi:hypothetical protein
MTWTWTEETGRKPNGREEKRTSLAVMLGQGPANETQAKGIYANQVVMWIHANQGHCYANQVAMWIRAN